MFSSTMPAAWHNVPSMRERHGHTAMNYSSGVSLCNPDQSQHRIDACCSCSYSNGQAGCADGGVHAAPCCRVISNNSITGAVPQQWVAWTNTLENL